MTHDWIKQPAIEIHACHNITDQKQILYATEKLIHEAYIESEEINVLYHLSEMTNCYCEDGTCWKCKAERLMGD